MARRFFSGSTLQQALVAAGREFGIDPDRVAYVRREKKHGFLKVRRRVVIEVDPEAPARAPADEAPAPAEVPSPASTGPTETWPPEEAEEAVPEVRIEADPEIGPEAGAVQEAARELVRFARLELEGKVAREEEAYVIDLGGADRARLLEEEAELLAAVEHLVPRLVRGALGQGVPCKVDSDGYLSEHTAEMEERARRAAEEVRRSGRSWDLGEMSPADRRLVHMALAEEPDVATESHGEGFYKVMTVVPAESSAEDERALPRA